MTDDELKAIGRMANPGSTIAHLCGELRAAREALGDCVRAWDKHVAYLEEHLTKAQESFQRAEYKPGLMLARGHLELIKAALLDEARKALGEE